MLPEGGRLLNRNVTVVLLGVVAVGLALLVFLPGPDEPSAGAPVAASPADPAPPPTVAAVPRARQPATGAAPSAAPPRADAPEVQPASPSSEQARSEADDDAPHGDFLYTPDVDGIREAIKAAAPEIQKCYQTMLHDYPDTSGKITIGFTVRNTDDGRALVREAEVVDSTADSLYMEGCTVTAMEDLPFSPLEDGELTVRWPFVFRPSAEAE